MFRGTLLFYLHSFFYLHNLKKSALSITVSVYSREVPVHVQREYRFCQFSKEGTDMDIHRILSNTWKIISRNFKHVLKYSVHYSYERRFLNSNSPNKSKDKLLLATDGTLNPDSTTTIKLKM